MTRFELLHHIQETPEALTMHDAVALLAGRLPDDASILAKWEEFTLELIAWKDRNHE